MTSSNSTTPAGGGLHGQIFRYAPGSGQSGRHAARGQPRWHRFQRHADRRGRQRLSRGGAGDDTAMFSHAREQYTVTELADRIVVAGPDGTDTLTGIEHLRFAVADPGPQPTPPGPEPAPPGPPDYISGLFDTVYYLTHYADVSAAGVSARDHYNDFGWHEGRAPNAFFDTVGYLGANPDLRDAGLNPLLHYHQTGWRDGRDPSAGFDTRLYLLHNPDVVGCRSARTLSAARPARGPRHLSGDRRGHCRRLRRRMVHAAQSRRRGCGCRCARTLRQLRLARRAQSQRLVRQPPAISRTTPTSRPPASTRSSTT